MLRTLMTSFLPIALPLAMLGGNMAVPSGGSDWIPVPAQSLAIVPGSALDFSGLVPPVSAGSRGQLTLDGDTLRFADGTAPRFNCGLVANGPNGTWAYPTHAQADAFAAQMRLHGYDLVRFHFTDARLLQHATHDFVADPDAFDRFHYLLAALKKNGIYWMLDMQTAFDAAQVGTLQDKPGPDSVRSRLNFDPAARAKWLGLVDALYATPNPYTGLSPLADPALAFVVGANENSLAFNAHGTFPSGFDAVFDSFLRMHFPNSAALAAAIPDLTPAEASHKALIALPAGWDATGPRADLLRRVGADLELQSYRWIQRQLAQRGYRGPVLAFPEWYRSQSNATRARLPIVDIHAYLGEATSNAAGTAMKLPSSTSDDGLNNWTVNAASRWLDKPLVASEFGVPIPNPYRYEGAFFPAIAAMQDYSTVCRMAGTPIEPAIPAPAPGAKPLNAYSVGLDPVNRATETLSTLLFFRGDMERLPGTVAVPFGVPQFGRDGAAFLPGGLRRTALLLRFGLIAPDKAAALPAPKLIVPPTADPTDLIGRAVARLGDIISGTTAQEAAALVQTLRNQGLLTANNQTDPAAGIYQSATRELIVDQNAGTTRITTPRTEAFTSTGPANSAALGQMTVESLSTGALVAASALDGQTLARSRRILLILTGDAANTGLQLQGSGPTRTLIDWGKLPILMRRVTADIALRGAGDGAKLSVLSLAGNPVGTLPVAGSAILRFRLDTGAILNSPTTYFLLQR